MKQEEFRNWKNELLDQVLTAFAAHAPLTNILCFKGARILNLRLRTERRQSLDIDSNLSMEFAISHPEIEEQVEYLENECEKALNDYFASQNPVRYQLQAVKGSFQPAKGHPFGWDGRTVTISVKDNKNPSVRGLPAVELEIASPEKLSPDSLSDLDIGGFTVNAYTLERIAGEKMRAFLSSLPVYIAKIGRRADHRRVKDLYDIARILSSHSIKEKKFWLTAGQEFKLACESRFIDCSGIETFAEGLEETELLYNQDPTFPKDIPFEQAWHSIETIVDFFEKEKIIPFSFPIPGK